MKMQVDIEGGLLHLITVHSPYRQRLRDLGLVEDNLCRVCGVVSTPDHVVLQSGETSQLAEEQQALLGDRTVAEALRNPELVAGLREVATKVSSYHRKKFVEGDRDLKELRQPNPPMRGDRDNRVVHD